VTAAGRALYLTDHPYCDPSTWDAVNEQTRAWWDARAQPIADACEHELADNYERNEHV
jgi:hypothetical protein